VIVGAVVIDGDRCGRRTPLTERNRYVAVGGSCPAWAGAFVGACRRTAMSPGADANARGFCLDYIVGDRGEGGRILLILVIGG
jgi:hypothetical protein